ncbi:carboxy-S-adenosyl-L-methionine synthase CmoA [Desulfobulbus sp.]|uniref:carboxy-S-adenosyl-L-methionine synthase CmoA n=1 Tax=Desulfobulbus sp. TaxID=895 RepID=UPI00286F4C07|nr:carboxy-S-adenosyl-L-methionine synthase CmoA [Desulfobulbus sp.]
MATDSAALSAPSGHSPQSTPADADLPGDTLYTAGTVAEDFAFNDRVAEVFDDMLNRSVPYYRTVIDGMAQLVACHLSADATVCDLGCSTGTTLIELARRLPELQLRYVGIDNAPAMLAKARRKSAMFSKSEVLRFVEADITTCPLPRAEAIVCNYTLQFLRPLTRQPFVRRIYEALPAGGVLFLGEKTISHSGRLNRDFIDIYHAFKKQQGYSELEIAAKREALENVLIPFSLEENVALLRQAGFAEIEPFFRWFNFTAIVALKR